MENKQEQEIFFKLSMFEQQMNQLQEQMNAVEEGISELATLNLGLDEIKGSKGKEILSPIGRGIFVKTTIASEDLTVDIGSKNFVKKNIPETKKIIGEQLKKLEDVKKDLQKNLEELRINTKDL
jgi:prefoldin alpha subunit